MKDSVYLYNVYDPKVDEFYIYKVDSPIQLGLWVRDDSSMVQVKELYRVTSKLHTTIYIELGLLVGVLLGLFILLFWMWRQLYKQNKKLR